MSSIVEGIDLWKIYKLDQVEVPALRGVTLGVNEGDFMALMGPSGCGKSTLLHLLGCLDQPTRGRVVFEGQDVSRLGDRQLTRIRAGSVGFVFQTFHLLPSLTVKDNVVLQLRLAGFGRRERSHMAEEALETVGLGQRLRHRPQQLSGGERQRVAIARAIAKKPKLLLADEPTGNLDSKMGAEIAEILKQLHRDGQTILMVTHDAGLASHAATVVGLRDGRLDGADAAQGSPGS
jgi:putative ABC transport system ATP-binding protein